tara:strand:+ start:813 stop:932 length:120 start_codon:yes stop_codon:yes gene_type:complete
MKEKETLTSENVDKLINAWVKEKSPAEIFELCASVLEVD